MILFQVGYVYKIGDRFCVCLFMDIQRMEAKFKIFETLEEARLFGTR